MTTDLLNSDAISELTPSDCPLINKVTGGQELIGLHNKVIEAFRFVEKLGTAVPAEELSRLRETYQSECRSRLTRRKYQVGFLGPFQSGKSTTFNAVLDASKGEEPAAPGQGKSKTSAITRLRVLSEGDPFLLVHYLSKAAYQEKRAFLCHQTCLDNLDGDANEARLLDAVKNRRMEVRQGKYFIRPDGKPVTESDLQYLGLLLLSRKSYPTKLGTPQIKVPFNDRHIYLNNPDEDDWLSLPAGVPGPLLEEVEVYYKTEAISEELEMIDLPGLSGLGSIERRMTTGFLDKLDGALVFCTVNQIAHEDVELILKSLQKRRCWIVITFCDALTDAQIFGHAGSTTTFHTLKGFLSQMGVPLANVCFVTNQWINNADSRFGFRPVPTALEEAGMEGLREAWVEFQRDGGIGRLRKLVKDDLPDLVGKGIVKTCQGDLNRFGRELLRLARRAGDSPPPDTKALAHANRCLEALHALLDDLDRGVLLRDMARNVQHILDDQLDRLRINPHVLDQMGNLGSRFVNHANVLQGVLDSTFDQIIDAAYSEVLPHIRTSEESEESDRIIVPGVFPDGLQAKWQDFRQNDLEKTTALWRQAMPSFRQYDPFESMEQGETLFLGEEYLNFIRRKIRVLSQQTALAMRSRLKEQIRFMIQDLDDYTLQYDHAREMPRGPEVEDGLRSLEETFGGL